MPKIRSVLSYEDRKYIQKKHLFDSVMQSFENVKQELQSENTWNMPSEQLNGITIRLVGEKLVLTGHRMETGTLDHIARKRDDGKPFIKQVEKALKKEFRKFTGKVLNLEREDENQVIEAHGGYSPRGARYYIRDSVTYEFTSSVEP